MQTTRVDADGTVRCPNCGATSFRSQRSTKAKVGLIPTLGAAALVAPKRLKCNGCGTYLRASEGTASKLDNRAATTAATKEALEPYAVDSVDLDTPLKGHGNRSSFDGHTLKVEFSRMVRATYSYPPTVAVPVADIQSVQWKPPTFAKNGELHIGVPGGTMTLLYTYQQRKDAQWFVERLRRTTGQSTDSNTS